VNHALASGNLNCRVLIRSHTGNMGNAPSLGTKGGTVVGALELNLCPGCCPCGGSWNRAGCSPCCPGLSMPSGPEWEAAQAGFKTYLDEAASIAYGAKGFCANPHKIKSALDAEWTAKADTYLATHGLQVEVCAYWTSDGKSSHPHVVLQFSKKA